MAYASTFAGVDFEGVDGRNLLTPIFAKRAKSRVREVPWGDRAIYQYLGGAVVSITVNILIPTADFATLESKVGTSGTLALSGGPSAANVVLDGLEDAGRDSVNGVTEARATFLRVPS